MAFLTDFIKKRVVDPAVNPLLEEIKKRDEVIKIQQDNLEKADVPRHFVVPFGAAPGALGQDIYRWRRIVDFKTLREFSERYDVARACINRRKRQVERVDWSIQPVNPSEKADKYQKQICLLEDFFHSPGGKYARFREFVNEMVEDLLVFDGTSIWKEKTVGGKLTKLITVDTETVRLRVMEDGSMPEPPEFAFEQWIRGQKVADFTTDEMMYLMLNPRSNTPYGLAPLESLILGVDAALRSQLYNLGMLTEGNVPEGFFALPETWSPDQIKEFQTWFDSLIAGAPRFQQRIKFMPGGKGVGYIATKKPEEMRFLEYEEWLLKKTCALFDVPPEEIGFTFDISRATAEVQAEVAMRAGLFPMLQTLKEFFDMIIKEDFSFPHLQFQWYSLDKKDELRDAEITERLVRIGAVSVDEWRGQNDLPPIGVEHYIMTPTGPVFVKELISAGMPAPAKKRLAEKEGCLMELAQWERKTLNDIKVGRLLRPFQSQNIDVDVKKLIEAQLVFVKNKGNVKEIFEKQISLAKQDEILKQALKLKEEIAETLKEYEIVA